MPVLQKEPSEYQRHYTWHQSRKSRAYSPPLEVSKPPAGVPSMIAAKASEPTITLKKKVNPSAVTSTTKFEYVPVEGEEYMLLGTNEKFAKNVQYRAKSRDRAMNLLRKAPAENGDAPSTPLTPRDPPPAPKVRYDPGAPKLKASKGEPTKSRAEPVMVTKSVEVRNERPEPEKSILKPMQKNATKHRHIEPVKASFPSKARPEPVLQEKKFDHKAKENKPPKDKQRRDKRESRKGKVHEYAQTDLEKGVSYSGQEASADYAMKYKAGVAPPRTRGPKRLSEYAMQFQWKKGFPSSPMLAAEQIVYKSNPQAPPFGHDTMAKPSEYNAQFKPWNMLKSTPNLKLALENEGPVSSGKKKARKHKRSRSLEGLYFESNIDLSPDARPAAGGITLVSVEDKRMLKESLNPQRLHFPHGKFKKVSSEYASNFAPPQKFDYEDGAWRGADPPHIMQRPEEDNHQPREGGFSAAWFKEVVELRKKADEYKKRALGTHFSHSHMAQLYAKQADLWDAVSDDGHQSVVSALSLESPAASFRSRQSSRASSRQARKSRKDAWYEDEERTLTPETSVGQRDYDDDDDEMISNFDSEAFSESQYSTSRQPAMGRLPTPKMQNKQTFVVKNRHHLDRTTPAVGGALLTSPPEAPETPSEDSCPRHSKSKKGLETWSVPNAHAARESISAPGLLQPNQRNKVCCTCGATNYNEKENQAECVPNNTKHKSSELLNNHDEECEIEHENLKKHDQTYISNAKERICAAYKSDNKNKDYSQGHKSISAVRAPVKIGSRSDNKSVQTSPLVKSYEKLDGRDSIFKVVNKSPFKDTSGIPTKLKILYSSVPHKSPKPDKNNIGSHGKEDNSSSNCARNYSPMSNNSKEKIPAGKGRGPSSKEAWGRPVINRIDTDGVPQGKPSSSDDLAEFKERLHELQRSIDEDQLRNQMMENELGKSPTYGKPTPDTHVLVDDDVASDHTLRLNFIKTMPEVTRERKELQSRLSTIKEMSGEYKSTKGSTIPKYTLTVDDIPRRPPTEDDQISFSARSIASSCSLASEVLERAKNRRDDFWGDS